MANTDLFKQKAPVVMRSLIDDFELEVVHAAGILGNIGQECGGFHYLREIGQPEGKGGYGWAQWTGPRRKTFLQWCQNNGLDWQSDQGNYGYLKDELINTEKSAIPALLKTTTLVAAVKAFERNYERAGTPNYKARNQWATIALAAYNNA